MMHICSIVGARPNFVKLAALSPELRKVAKETIIHTGQHYDYEMSESFFKELNIPSPTHHLGVGSGSHGKQTGNILYFCENILESIAPDAVIVFGDTNSTLAGALAAAKLHIPVVHIEAGERSFDRRMPEETNRVIVDHISDMLFCSTENGYQNLRKEGISPMNCYVKGDLMVDLMSRQSDVVLQDVITTTDSYHLLTVHREENANYDSIENIFIGLAGIDSDIVFPCHPRVRKLIVSTGLTVPKNIHTIDPVGYFEMRALEKNALKIITDSGGVQKEAYMLGKPCVTLRNNTEWVETQVGNWNILAGTSPQNIVSAMREFPDMLAYKRDLFGKPGVAKVIAHTIVECLHG